MRRVNVVGNSGSGKTTFAAALAARLGVPHVEIDALNWAPNWTEVPDDVLRERVGQAVAADAWVVDGNYGRVRDLIWSRADTVVWLDFPLSIVLSRVIRRTARRVISREQLWSGNRERLGTALGRDSIIWWALTSYRRQRRDYPRLLAAHPELDAVRLRSPDDARRWLRHVTGSAAEMRV